MIPAFLVPESVSREGGQSAAVALDSCQGRTLSLTLGINRVLEQQSLEVSIWGSSEGQSWKHVASFPQKCYCGTYSLILDLSRHPDVAYIQARWKMERWARGGQKPLFGFYIFVEQPRTMQVAGAA
jgi:hypothetical protein